MTTLKKLYLNGTAYDLAYDSTITIQVNWTTVKTITLNQASGDTINISVPTKTSDLTNDSGFITNAVNDLTNYYKKTDTYTQAEVNSLISDFGGFQVVATLPTQNIKTNIIYLKWPIGSWVDKYEEYIYSNNTWVQIGETSVDLTNYFNTSTQTSDNITEGSTHLFMTTAERTKLGNQSGTNTGDETQATIKNKLWKASASQDGYLAKEDFATFNGKQDAISDLSTIRSWASAWATAVQPWDDVSDLNNDAWYITSADLPGVGNATITVKQWWTNKGSFTTNQSSAGEINLNTSFLKTQAEYDALPNSKSTDGNFYFIYES